MQWSLSALILMGQCSFFTCQLYQYRFIEEEKTWSEAQKYCRNKHTDLATVSNMTDMKKLQNILKAKDQPEAWIGLHNQTDANGSWHWSLPGVEFNETEANERWENETQPVVEIENCGFIKKHLSTGDIQWGAVSCNEKWFFICYNESNPSKKFHLMGNNLDWQDAQKYCRSHHTDLVSGRDQVDDQQLKDEIESLETWMFIGLFRDTWRWSDQSSFSFRHWNHQPDEECGMLDDGGCWEAKDCDEEKPFFCYNDKVILIKENMTWEDAIYYCRENHRDLVSIRNVDEQRWVQERAKKANTPYVWLGLRYTCTLEFWFWVSDEVVDYKNWVSSGETDDCDMSGAMETGGQHKWFKKSDEEKFNFICFK